jgi:hypothetical protein
MRCEKNVANLADQEKRLDTKGLTTPILVRQLADQDDGIWRTRLDVENACKVAHFERKVRGEEKKLSVVGLRKRSEP